MYSEIRSSTAALTLLAIGACSHGGAPRFTAADTLSTATTVGTAPMLAVSPRHVMASAWVSAPSGGTDGRLYVSTSDKTPAEIRDSLGPIEGHGESPPKLAWSPDGGLNALYVVVKDVATAPQPLEALRFVRSDDGGQQWSAPVTVTHDVLFGVHNFHALHVADDGTIYVSWLGGESGPSTVWIAHSSDSGRTWSNAVRVDTGRACDCCRTALATSREGVVYIAWRHLFPDSIRDVVVARSVDHGATWSAPVRAHADNWQFDGCPRAGPAIAVDSTGRVHVAWWTGRAHGSGVWYASSDDSARSFSSPEALGVADVSRPAHVQLALAHGDVAAVWDDGRTPQNRILFRLSRDRGHSFGPAVTLDQGAGSSFPVAAVSGDTITTAWTESGTPPAPMKMSGAAKMAHRGIKPVGNAVIVVRQAKLE